MTFAESLDDWARDEDRRIDRAPLIDLLARFAICSYFWEELMREQIRKVAALQATNSALREELRRYTAARVA